MKSGEKHFFTSSWSHLTEEIEQAFFHIERRRSWLAAVINGGIAGAAVALVTWLVVSLQEGEVLLFACLGSSAASMVFAPLNKANSLRTVVGAYLIAALVCLILLPVHVNEWLPIPLQCFLAVALAVAAMRVSDTMHPAAIGSAMAFIIFDHDPRGLLLLLFAIMGLLTVVKLMAYVYLEDLEFRNFANEFRREYYGREVTVTIVENDEESG